MLLDSKGMALASCISSQLPTSQLVNEGSLERIVEKSSTNQPVMRRKYSRLYRTQIILSATLIALAQIWHFGK
ncbi:hypothetical protein SDC9_116188 [bioreactor metagenome]|uniref:Uncharacterized protein n=1 Tax=bioreactor metagenome TaxID=1076179 RepID=A0A645C5L7_9ZZZZ|nr:hypothetical protein [Erysipelotrichaceae bacterium]